MRPLLQVIWPWIQKEWNMIHWKKRTFLVWTCRVIAVNLLTRANLCHPRTLYLWFSDDCSLGAATDLKIWNFSGKSSLFWPVTKVNASLAGPAGVLDKAIRSQCLNLSVGLHLRHKEKPDFFWNFHRNRFSEQPCCSNPTGELLSASVLNTPKYAVHNGTIAKKAFSNKTTSIRNSSSKASVAIANQNKAPLPWLTPMDDVFAELHARA